MKGACDGIGCCKCIKPASVPSPTSSPTTTPTTTLAPPPPDVVPVPPPYVPCDETRDIEFHSLRPYQASPCNQNPEDLALFCGPDIIVYDQLTITKEFNGSGNDWNNTYTLEQTGELQDPVCNMHVNPDGDGLWAADSDGLYRETCWFEVNRSKNFAIDLKDAYLPIMGNTEMVWNSQNQPEEVLPDGLDNPTKVNEYVSWYINGIIGRAEYDPPRVNNSEGERRIIDFSGPLKKLLSYDSQELIRTEEIQDAEDERHNQFVVCVNLSGNPTHCYPERIGVRKIRMTNISQELLENFEYVPFSSTEDRVGIVDPYVSSNQYISSTLYLTNVYLTNIIPADLYFSHMQESFELADLLQQLFVYQGGPIDDYSFEKTDPPPFCDVSRIRNNPGDNLFPTEISATVNYTVNFACDFLIPFSGNLCRALAEGECINTSGQICDQYFGQIDCLPGTECANGCQNQPSSSSCPSGYRCVPGDWNCADIITSGIGCPGGWVCGNSCTGGISSWDNTQECIVEPYVRIGTNTFTPLAKEVFAKTVAGKAGVFKRFPPKIEVGAPIESILDIPAASPVEYVSLDGSSVVAGNPATGRSGSDAEIYFPHIGSIHQYFLKCIQTILRPQGYGDYCPSGGIPPLDSAEGCPEDVPDEQIAGIDGGYWLGPIKDNFITMADNWVYAASGCSGPENNLAEECYNYVVRESDSKNINPAFSLTIWLNESDASNYCFGGPTTQDFGINDPSVYMDIEGQLAWFLDLPYSGTYNWCKDQPGWIEPMHAFLSRFRAGGCDPSNSAGNTYYNNIRTTTWPWVTMGSCSSEPTFAPELDWPDDRDCPP